MERRRRGRSKGPARREQRYADLNVLLDLDPEYVPETEEEKDYKKLFAEQEARREQRIVRREYQGMVGLTAEEIEVKMKKEAAILLMLENTLRVRGWDLPVRNPMAAMAGGGGALQSSHPSAMGLPMDSRRLVHRGKQCFFGKLGGR